MKDNFPWGGEKKGKEKFPGEEAPGESLKQTRGQGHVHNAENATHWVMTQT